MTPRFHPEESTARGARRVATELLADAAAAVTQAGDAKERIHRARTRLKRVRALLRVARPGMIEAEFRAEKARVSEIGHLLGPARDAEVVDATLASLAD
ncbi:MAG TPA: CHAD domain-containing protein, partial [Minicystis sp.]|nr:CHAD domain-containing protein [Minicystis sp.]